MKGGYITNRVSMFYQKKIMKTKKNLSETSKLNKIKSFTPIGFYERSIQNLQWPNLKNLSGGLNLSRGLNMVGST